MGKQKKFHTSKEKKVNKNGHNVLLNCSPATGRRDL
jgi:hypothetical protein